MYNTCIKLCQINSEHKNASLYNDLINMLYIVYISVMQYIYLFSLEARMLDAALGEKSACLRSWLYKFNFNDPDVNNSKY